MANVTIAQALRRAKKLKGQIDESRTRAAGCASFFTDSPPAFQFDEQLKRADGACDELAELESRISAANAANSIVWRDRNLQLCWCVRMLADLKGRLAWLRALQVKQQASTMELVNVHTPGVGYQQMARPAECKLPEAAKAALIEQIQDRFDELNALVEAANHTITI